MTTPNAPTKILRMPQRVLAAYASGLAIVIGGAVGVSVAGLAASIEHASATHTASSVTQMGASP